MENSRVRSLTDHRLTVMSQSRRPAADNAFPSGAPKPKLLDRVRLAIRTRHYSYKTEEAYVGWIRRFILFHNKRHPSEMAETEIGQFLSSLARDSHVSASTQNQALNALLFLYHQVLEKNIGLIRGVVCAKRPRRLPVILTKEEVKRLLGCLQGTPRLMAVLLYGAGLRLMECCRLRVKDIDFSRNQIAVRAGKGNKDRYTVLPAALKESLFRHLQAVKRQHEDDLKKGLGHVALPHARKLSHLPPFLRHAFTGRRLRHQDRSGAARAPGCEHFDDLHPCSESRGKRRAELGRCTRNEPRASATLTGLG